MSKARRWLTVILTLVLLSLLGFKVIKQDNVRVTDLSNRDDPTYTTASSRTTVYNPQGILTYQLISGLVRYYDNQQLSWFDKPVLTTYDQKHVATWTLQSDKAKLTNDNKLYLYGHVLITALSKDSRLQHVATNSAIIDLTSQDVSSDDKVQLTGQGFTSTGEKLRGNLQTKTAKLLEKVITSYEIQNKK